MTDDNASVSLSEAAEELIKAAHRVVETSSQGKDLSSFKESLDAKINTVNQNICQLKDQVTIINANIDAKLNTVNQNIHQLKDQVTKVNAGIEHLTKMQSLEWAINNLNVLEGYSFQYRVHKGDIVKESKHDVKEILLCFRQGRGCYISDGDVATSYMSSEKTKSEFRDKLVNYVYMLTGVMPRLQLEDNGKYVIYYS